VRNDQKVIAAYLGVEDEEVSVVEKEVGIWPRLCCSPAQYLVRRFQILHAHHSQALRRREPHRSLPPCGAGESHVDL